MWSSPELCDILWPEEWFGRGRTLLISIAVLAVLKRYLGRRKQQKLRLEWDSVGKDVVLLHQFWRGKYCPNLSPFALKVETFLRLNNIKYVVDDKSPMSVKHHKCPWITLNGEDICDSEFIIEHLRNYFSIDLDKKLDEQKKATLETARLAADEYLFWCVITWRYYQDRCVTFMKSQTFSRFWSTAFPLFMPRGIKHKAGQQGMGLYSNEEVYQICKKTCKTFSSFLGEQPFFGGDEPCTADCAIFGQLAQLMWNAPGSRYEALITDVFPNLGQYCLRMKLKVYPNWNQLLNPPLPSTEE
ncbi:unnamed protein product [Meganyctiphanes norvegica]|uniref:Uncharacterized protein n=1 Tax=Meganyctiphanes norvegica TaxID=48144 RepID=A0AAV2PJ11_MEGNR